MQNRQAVMLKTSGVARILLQGARARGSRVPKFAVTKSSKSESHIGVRSAKTNMVKVFFATAWHSNSNQCFNMRDKPISTKKNRPYWNRPSHTPGGTCPSAPCLKTPLLKTLQFRPCWSQFYSAWKCVETFSKCVKFYVKIPIGFWEISKISQGLLFLSHCVLRVLISYF